MKNKQASGSEVPNYGRTQEIGADGLIVPSARWPATT
jgi:hypothetical protein